MAILILAFKATEGQSGLYTMQLIFLSHIEQCFIDAKLLRTAQKSVISPFNTKQGQNRHNALNILQLIKMRHLSQKQSCSVPKRPQ